MSKKERITANFRTKTHKTEKTAERRCVPKDTTPTLFAYGEWYCFAVIFGLRRVVFATRVLWRIEYNWSLRASISLRAGRVISRCRRQHITKKPLGNAHLLTTPQKKANTDKSISAFLLSFCIRRRLLRIFPDLFSLFFIINFWFDCNTTNKSNGTFGNLAPTVMCKIAISQAFFALPIDNL